MSGEKPGLEDKEIQLFGREDLPGHLNRRLNDWEIALLEGAVAKYVSKLGHPVIPESTQSLKPVEGNGHSNADPWQAQPIKNLQVS